MQAGASVGHYGRSMQQAAEGLRAVCTFPNNPPHRPSILACPLAHLPACLPTCPPTCLQRCYGAGADIVKFATMANDITGGL